MDNQHRYQYLDQYLKKRFGSKVFKVALNGNFTCPNRDGTIQYGGCIFCSDKGSGDFAGNPNDDLNVQFEKVKNLIHLKWPTAKYIAYFQANTNTYGPIEKLRRLFYEAINLDENIVALSIATRPDCLSDEVLDLLGEINRKIPVWVELGLQTIHESTAEYIHRGYKLDVFEKAVFDLRARNIEVIVHIINGLPHETIDMMLETVSYLNCLPIQGIKIHSLFILENTLLASYYQSGDFNEMELDEYILVTAKQLSILREDIIIHRINGDAPREQLIAPLWSLKKLVVMNELDKYMKDHDLYQGKEYKKA